MQLFHLRDLTEGPSLEGVCPTSPHKGWTPERDSGALGTGVYATTTIPRITEPARLYTYTVGPTTLYEVSSIERVQLLERWSRALMRYVVGSLHRSYGDNAPHAPLAAWYDRYDDLPALKADLLTLSRRLCDQHDDALTRYVRAALGDTEDFLFDFITGYSRYLRSGPALEQSGCDVKRTPFAHLLMELDFKGLMYGGEAAHLNDTPSHGVVLFDPTTPHTVTRVEPGWAATQRSALLYRASRTTRRAAREQDEQRAVELQAFVTANLRPPTSVEDHHHSLPLCLPV